MKRIIVFAGTTEGRELSEGMTNMGIPHILCVATEYGEMLIRENPLVSVHKGRMTESEMEEFISDNTDLVFDATHPFAVIVTDNIRTACARTDTPYIRIVRERTRERYSCDGPEIHFFDNSKECGEALKHTKGNILLTTGSKELSSFTLNDDLIERLYVRVLPSVESIELCNNAGIKGQHIIAMQGPFDTELNRAIMSQYNIGVLVTKETGITGGYPEKLEAAKEKGVAVYVIGRPFEDGLSVKEALTQLNSIEFENTDTIKTEGNWNIAVNSVDDLEHDVNQMEIYMIGIGPGSEGYLSLYGKEIIDTSEIIFGAERMIANYSKGKKAYPYYLAKDVIPILRKELPSKAAILFSGDSSFYSGAEKMKSGLLEDLGHDGLELHIEVVPGISSISYFAARIGISYSDSIITSLHGRSKEKEYLERIFSAIYRKEKVFTLLSGIEDIETLVKGLKERGLDETEIVLGYNLSYPDEEIIYLSEMDGNTMDLKNGLYVALITQEL